MSEHSPGTSGSPAQGWAEYAEYARRIDAVRAQETARTAGIREGAAQMSGEADRLQDLLANQRVSLAAFAQKVKFRPPAAGEATPPEGFVEPQTDLARVAQLIDTAEKQGADAHNRAILPNLLPTARPFLRGFAVYGAVALVLMVVQRIAFAQTGNNPDFLRFGVLLPLLGFVLATVVLRQGNKARDRDVVPAPVPTRLGLLLCFLTMPVVWAFLVATTR